MSDSEGCDINCTCVRCKGKKRVTRIEETSFSDSDSPVAKSTKRKKAPRVLSDGQGSSSETDSIVLGKRKKRKHAHRVMSDDEASSGSGPRPLRRKKSARVVSESEEVSTSDEYDSSGIDDNEDEEMPEEDHGGEATRESSSDSWEEGEGSGSASSGWESDWTSMDEEFDEDVNEDSGTVKVSTKLPGVASSVVVSASCESDSSDGQSEKCPICLRNFTTQEVGTPEACDHSFCAVCLQEWAKNMNTCPVDRQAFTLILVRSCLEGKIVRRIPVESREQRDDDQEIQEDPTPCEICGRCDREDRLLLCDECDSGYHLDCLDPPLETVPVEEWFCPECVVANSTQIADEAPIGEGELLDLIDDAHATIGSSPLRRRVNRLLPRTRQSERVRTTIIRQEIERQVAAGGTQPSTSSGVDSLDSASRLSLFFGGRRTATGGVKKKVVRRRRRRVRRRKVRRRTTTSTKTSTKSKTTTKSKVSVTDKSGTTKRKVKKKTTRKTKRQTKRKVEHFDSSSNSSVNEQFFKSLKRISCTKKCRSKRIVEDSDSSACSSLVITSATKTHWSKRIVHSDSSACCSKTLTVTKKDRSKKRIVDSDSDSSACYSRFLTVTPSTKKHRSKRTVDSDSDSSACCSTSLTPSTKKHKFQRIVEDSESDNNKPRSSKSVQ